jgi:hypothetical protein
MNHDSFGMIFCFFRTGPAYRDSLHRIPGGPPRSPVSNPGAGTGASRRGNQKARCRSHSNGSVIELLNVIDPLVNPTAHGASAADAFDVVIPRRLAR